MTDEYGSNGEDWLLYNANESKDFESGAGYLDRLRNENGLIVLQEHAVRQAYHRSGNFSLFRLFLTGCFTDIIRQRTNSSGKLAQYMQISELNSLITLQLAMSIVWQAKMGDYWSSDRFKGVPGFRDVMSRNRFMEQRGALRFTSEGDVYSTPEKKSTRSFVA